MPTKSTSTKKRTAPAKVRTDATAAKTRTGSPTAKPRNGTAAKPKGVVPITKSSNKAAATKTDIILDLLRRKEGASVEEMAAATDWQAHSVRGFLSGTVKKKLALPLDAEKTEGGARRYFVRAAS